MGKHTSHKCATCGKVFDLKRYLTKHEIRMHKNPNKKTEEDEEHVEKNLKCSMCDKVFPRLSHLQRHQMTHLNVRNFACDFCDEKFVQKAHLTRHLARKHANESGVEVEWTACDKCGKLFKTVYEWKRHVKSVHVSFRCKRCGEEGEGNNGMQRHLMSCREENFICTHCEASFARKADLKSHKTSCLRKVSFVCVPCDEYFKQRVQLDRHINNQHFKMEKCSDCEHFSESPVENARHALNCRKITICGYCNLLNPDAEHISENHWRRLKRAMKAKRARRETEKMLKKKKKKEDVGQNSEDVVTASEDVEPEEILNSEEPTTSIFQNSEIFGEISEESENEMEEEAEEGEEEEIFEFPEPTSSQFDFTSSAFLEEDVETQDFLTFSICPNPTDLKFDMAGKLPPELVELFPILESTSIVLLHQTAVPCRFTVQVPVFIPKNSENEQEMREWLKEPIFID